MTQTKPHQASPTTALRDETAAAAAATPPRRSPAVTFVLHYAEMVVAMLLGMAALVVVVEPVLELGGADISAWDTEAPAAHLLAMAFAMTVPMVAWMRHRGHGWAPCWEMSAAMFVPTFVAIGLLWAGAMTDIHGLLMIQHIAMFPLMFAVMLLRRDEYTRH